MEIRKKAKFILAMNKPIIYKSSKILLTTERRLKENTNIIFNIMRKKIPWKTYWKYQLLCIRVWVHIFSELSLKKKQDQKQ